MDQDAVGKLNSAGIIDIQDILNASPQELETLSVSLDIAHTELRIINATARMLNSAWMIIERHMDLRTGFHAQDKEAGSQIEERPPSLLGLYPSRISIDLNSDKEAEVRDTGFTVSQVLHQLSTGGGYQALMSLWPELEQEDIQACLSYASLILSKTTGAA